MSRLRDIKKLEKIFRQYAERAMSEEKDVNLVLPDGYYPFMTFHSNGVVTATYQLARCQCPYEAKLWPRDVEDVMYFISIGFTQEFVTDATRPIVARRGTIDTPSVCLY